MGDTVLFIAIAAFVGVGALAGRVIRIERDLNQLKRDLGRLPEKR